MSSTMVPNLADTPGTAVHTSIEGPTLSQSVDAHAHAVVSAVKDHIPGLSAAKSDANDTQPDVASNEATKEAQGIPAPRRQPSSSADAYAEQPGSTVAAADTSAAATPALEKELELKKNEVEKATSKEDKISARRKEKEDKLKAKEAERQKKLDAKRNKEQNSLQSLLAKHTNAKAASDAKRRELEEKIKQIESRSQAKQAPAAAAVAAPVAASAASAQAPVSKQAPVVSGTESAAEPTPAVPKISKSALASLSGQVAGHESGVYTTANGSLVVKPCLPLESQFYQNTLIDRPANLSKTQKSLLQRLSRYLSTYHGTLDIVDDAANTPATRAVIMENLIQGYKHPNVLDIKLGKQLWDESASADKRARMDEQSKTTTSGKTGVRLTGWQAWDNESSQYVKVDKAFGKSITVSQLDLGIRSFFGVGSDADSKVISDLVKTHIATVHAPTKGVERILLQNIVPAVKEIHDIVKKLEWRVRGGSILIVYEGDASILESASAKSFPPSGRTSSQKDDVIDPTKLDSLGSAGPLPRLADVRLIDFAHATFTPGKGPDDGYLTGIETTRSMLEKLAKDVRKGKVGKASKVVAPAAAAAAATKSTTLAKDKETDATTVPANSKVTSVEDKPVTSADQTLTTAPIVAAAAVPAAALAATAAKDDGTAKTAGTEKDAKDANKEKQEKPRRFGSIFGRKNSTKKTKTDEKKPQTAVEPAIKEENAPVQEKVAPVAAKQADIKDPSVSQEGTTAIAAPPLTGAVSSPSDIKEDHTAEQDTKEKAPITVATSNDEESNIGAMAGVGSTIGAGSVILASDDDPKEVSEITEQAQTVDRPVDAVALPKEDNKATIVEDTQGAPVEKDVANVDQQKEVPTTSNAEEEAKAPTSNEGGLAAAGAAVAGGAGAAALLHSSKKDDDKEEEEKKEAEKKAAAEKKEAEEKAAAEKKEAERKAAEEKEAERKAAAEKKEAERKAAEEKKEADRKAAAEKKEAERKAAEEKKEAERKVALAEKQAAEEKKAKAEEEKKAKKEAETKRLAEEKEAKEAQKAQEKEAKEAKKAQEKEAKKAAKEAKKEPSQSEASDSKSENRKSGFGALFATPLAAKGASLIHSDGQTKVDQDSPSVSGAPSGGVVNGVSSDEAEKQPSSEEKPSKISALLAPLSKRDTEESHAKGPSFSAAPAGAEQTSKAEGEGLERKASRKAGLGGVFGLKRKNTADTQKTPVKTDHEKPEAAVQAPVSSAPVPSADAATTTEAVPAPAPKSAVEAPEPTRSDKPEDATEKADDEGKGKNAIPLVAAAALPAAALLKSSSSEEAKEAKQEASEEQPPPTPSKEEHESTGLFGGLMRRKTQKAKDAPSPPVKDEAALLHAEAEKARKAALQAKVEAEKARLEAKRAKEEAERAHAEVEAAKAERAKLEKERKKQASKENRKSGLSLFGFGGGANKKDGEVSPTQPQAQEKSATQNDGFVLVSGHKGNSTDSSPADSQIAPEILAAIEVGEPRAQKTDVVTSDKPKDVESSAVAAEEPKEATQQATAKNAPPVPAKDAAAAAAAPTATASHSSSHSSAQDASKGEGKAPKKLGRVASLWHGKGNANGDQSAPESSGSGARRSLSSRKSSSKEAAGKVVEEVVEEVDGVQRKFIRVTNPPRGAGKSASAVQWRG